MSVHSYSVTKSETETTGEIVHCWKTVDLRCTQVKRIQLYTLIQKIIIIIIITKTQKKKNNNNINFLDGIV